jgi:toxin YoeB
MSYSIELTIEAISDIKKFRKSGDKKALIKIDKLLDELRDHPTTGTGRPTWSRRINDKHRLIYRIEDDKVIVIILSFWGHYGDK